MSNDTSNRASAGYPCIARSGPFVCNLYNVSKRLSIPLTPVGDDCLIASILRQQLIGTIQKFRTITMFNASLRANGAKPSHLSSMVIYRRFSRQIHTSETLIFDISDC